jgi:hypothetical protein
MGHEGAAARRAQNQQDGQEQPTQPLPYHPVCLTCFRLFAKKIFSGNQGKFPSLEMLEAGG